jgi:D-alanyl-D-alanine carboxypeptidase/D-alanyl-D-alanine-endopeptidase (penicillin-binding protein 4)
MKKIHLSAVLLMLFLTTACRNTAREPATLPVQPAPEMAQVQALDAKLDSVLHQLDNGGAVFSARVVDLSNGRELYSSRADEASTPASNMKIQTTCTALDRFGPDYIFKTYLAMDGDDLWLIGTGDPSCGDPDMEKKLNRTPTSMLDDWAAALKQKGITQIKGRLLFYDGAFDDQHTNPSWPKGELVDWSAAPVAGLNFNDNCVDVTVIPAAPGQPVQLSVMPPTANEKVINECVTAAPGEKDSAAIHRDGMTDTFHITGKAAKKQTLGSKPVTDPGEFFADALRTNLQSHGITIAGDIQRAPSPLGGSLEPPADKVVAVYERTFSDVLTRLNKDSQNLFAEAFCKLVGRSMRPEGENEPGSWASGSDAIHAFLQRNHIDDSKLVVVDGSGLDHGNKVTTHMISDELFLMWRHRYHEAFFNSLPVAGKNGTIRKRMDDIAGHVFAKTGYIRGVRSLSGYVQTRAGQWLAFSIIFNHIPGDVHPAEDCQDNACRVLYEWPNIDDAKLRPVRKPTTESDD